LLKTHWKKGFAQIPPFGLFCKLFFKNFVLQTFFLKMKVFFFEDESLQKKPFVFAFWQKPKSKQKKRNTKCSPKNSLEAAQYFSIKKFETFL
jgi:hypothetical protein